MRVLELKIVPGFLRDIISGDKTFELRYDDKLYSPGDVLRLHDGSEREPVDVQVTYVLSSFELAQGYVALGIRLMDSKRGRE